ncbi:MAG TPA: hypothetical protein VJI33_02305 [Candidatus Paceibacterota bacterium]
MEKFTITKFTPIQPNVLIARLLMSQGNERHSRVKIMVRKSEQKPGGVLEVRGKNALSGAPVIGHFEPGGSGWIAYP